MNVKVSIPVEVGGFTGQRDAWESFPRDYSVQFDEDGRLLLESDNVHVRARKIWLDLDDLMKAVEFARREGGQQ